MKCDRCEKDKNMWTELFSVKKPGHTPDEPKHWWVCGPCYPEQLKFEGKKGYYLKLGKWVLNK